MSREFRFYNEFHLGDCLYQCHFMRKLAVAHPDSRIRLYCLPSYHAKLNEMVRDIPIISIHNLADRPRDAVNSWINTDFFFRDQPISFPQSFSQFYVNFFAHLAKKIGVEPLLKEKDDLLFDYPALLEHTKIDKDFDYLIFNGRALSGQFNYNQYHMNDLINSMNKKYKIIITNKCDVGGVECADDHGLSVTGIGHLSMHCDHIITVGTGGAAPTWNIWNNTSVKTRYVLVEGINYDYPEHCKRFHFNSVAGLLRHFLDTGIL